MHRNDTASTSAIMPRNTCKKGGINELIVAEKTLYSHRTDQEYVEVISRIYEGPALDLLLVPAEEDRAAAVAADDRARALAEPRGAELSRENILNYFVF